MNRPYEGKNGNSVVSGRLAPGVSIPGTFVSENVLGVGEPTNILQGSGRALYVMGWIDYSDDLKVARRTSFCRRYDPSRQRFVAVDDPDYENAE
jgi:hypothetical protein